MHNIICHALSTHPMHTKLLFSGTFQYMYKFGSLSFSLNWQLFAPISCGEVRIQFVSIVKRPNEFQPLVEAYPRAVAIVLSNHWKNRFDVQIVHDCTVNIFRFYLRQHYPCACRWLMRAPRTKFKISRLKSTHATKT